jgi:hypothetical protein
MTGEEDIFISLKDYYTIKTTGASLLSISVNLNLKGATINIPSWFFLIIDEILPYLSQHEK